MAAAVLLMAPPYGVVVASPRHGGREGAAADSTEPEDYDGTSSEEGAEAPGGFDLRVQELSLELSGEYQERRVRTEGRGRGRGRSSQENRDARFDEAVRLRLDGFLVDPRVARWDAALTLGLTQEESREAFNGFSRDDRDSGLLLAYDLSLDLFPDRPLSGHVYARQSRDRIPRRFLPSLLEERSEAGAAAFWTQGIWRGQFSFDWSDVDRTGNRGKADDEHLENSRLSLENEWTFSDRHRLRVVLDHEREESDYQGSLTDFDTRREAIRVEHDYAFGREGKHRLSTYLRYSDEDGTYARDEWEAVSRLTLRHTERFETAYRISAYEARQEAVDLTRVQGDVQAIYRPNERWRVTGNAFALREHVDADIETQQFGGGGDVSYRQSTSRGELRGDFSVQADQWRTVGDTGGGAVLGERQVLDSVRAAYLREADVLPGTLRVFNAARTQLYVEGRDYLAARVGRRTSMYRILSGRIAEGEAVSVDYRYRVAAGSRVNTYRTDLRVEHAFTWGWTPYYALELRRQDADGSRAAPVFEDNTERQRFGVRLERSQWSGGGEYERVHDEVEPYEAFHVDARVALWRGARHDADASARASLYDFEGDQARRVTWFEVDAMDRYRLTPHLSGLVKAVYRWEDNSRDGRTEGVDLEGRVEYRRGALRVELILEYDALDIRGSRDRGYGVWLNIRRDLTHLVSTEGRRR